MAGGWLAAGAAVWGSIRRARVRGCVAAAGWVELAAGWLGGWTGWVAGWLAVLAAPRPLRCTMKPLLTTLPRHQHVQPMLCGVCDIIKSAEQQVPL